MPSRKRGGQPGNTNAVTHGRYSAATRAARRAEFEEMRAREQAWMAKLPPFPWHVVDELKRLRREKDGEGTRLMLGRSGEVEGAMVVLEDGDRYQFIDQPRQVIDDFLV